MKIAVVAPSCTLRPEAAEAVTAIVALAWRCGTGHPSPMFSVATAISPDSDAARLAALRDVMADDSVDAIWFARGGYGSNRIAEAAVARPAAGRAIQDLSRLFRCRISCWPRSTRRGSNVAHGPMVQDIARDGRRGGDPSGAGLAGPADEAALEPGLSQGRRAMAFNLTVLSHLLGTAIEPDFTGAELLIEDVAEHEYRIDRTMFHVTGSPAIRRVAAIRMGRMSEIPDNDPAFGQRRRIHRPRLVRTGRNRLSAGMPISAMTRPIGSFRSTIVKLTTFDARLPLAHRGESRSISLRTTGGPNGKRDWS